VIASDECYAELGWDGRWADERVPSILDPRVIEGNRHNVLAVYSLSKQSNLAGYRAAFVAGCRTVIDKLVTVRKHAGLMLPAPLQAAMVAALGDDAHVAAQRELYRQRRAVLKPALEAAGFRIDHSEAGLYLWVTEGRDAWETVGRFADRGIVVGPGVFYGDSYPQHVRLSLTATDERIAEAVVRLEKFGDSL
jgi:aspartate/methionine/tyrosine aminotransferase